MPSILLIYLLIGTLQGVEKRAVHLKIPSRMSRKGVSIYFIGTLQDVEKKGCEFIGTLRDFEKRGANL